MSFYYRRMDFKDSYTGINFDIFYDWTDRNSTPENCAYRAKCIVSSIAAALKDMEIGWDLDTSYKNKWATDTSHANCYIINGYIDIPIMNGTDLMPGIVLKNTESGNRLFIGYLCNSNSYGINLPTEQLFSAGTYNSYGPNQDRPSYTGLVMSMIPGDSTQRFGSFSDDTFIPSHATRLYGMCEANSINGGSVSTKSSYARASFLSNYQNHWFCYGVLATPYCVAMAANNSGVNADDNSIVFPEHLRLSFACGRILGGLSNDENLPQSRYGVLQFSLPNGRECYEKGRSTEIGTTGTLDVWTTNKIGFEVGSEEDTYGCLSFRNTFLSNNAKGKCVNLGNIFKANGSAIGLTSTSNIRIQPDPYLQLGRNLKDNDTNIKWCPFVVGVVSTNLQQDGIIPGDGLKGYLDTNLFRCARVQSGQTFSNGQFYSLDYNLVIGWSSTNDIKGGVWGFVIFGEYLDSSNKLHDVKALTSCSKMGLKGANESITAAINNKPNDTYIMLSTSSTLSIYNVYFSHLEGLKRLKILYNAKSSSKYWADDGAFGLYRLDDEITIVEQYFRSDFGIE